MEDPRKIGLKNGLRQLTIPQLKRVINYPGNMVLDTYNYENGKFCPLAVALGFDENFENPTHEKVFNELTRLGYKVYNTRGISGEFYTDNRKEDLLLAAREVLAEKGYFLCSGMKKKLKKPGIMENRSCIFHWLILQHCRLLHGFGGG